MATLEAWKQFVSSVPEAQREYRTIEVWHPSFAAVRRFVSSYTDLAATLEAGAPRDPGAAVTFSAATLEIVEPAEREDSEQVLSVRFGNVDGTIHDIIDQIAGTDYFTPVQVVYRKYYSGDLTQPAIDPFYLFASSVSFDGPALVSFIAEDVDFSQKRAGSVYTLENFPGLRE